MLQCHEHLTPHAATLSTLCCQGLITTLAIGVHNVPEGLAKATVLVSQAGVPWGHGQVALPLQQPLPLEGCRIARDASRRVLIVRAGHAILPARCLTNPAGGARREPTPRAAVEHRHLPSPAAGGHPILYVCGGFHGVSGHLWLVVPLCTSCAACVCLLRRLGLCA